LHSRVTYGANPPPLDAWDAFTTNLPAPVQPEVSREVRSWLILVRDSRVYVDVNDDAMDWYTRAQRVIALADDALPDITDAASLKLAQLCVSIQWSSITRARRARSRSQNAGH
jgi:hypothetical protein